MIKRILTNRIVLSMLLALTVTAFVTPELALARGVRHGRGGHPGGAGPGGPGRAPSHHHHPRPHPHPHVHVHMWHPHFWHPIGFFVTALAVTAIVVSVSGQDYHYDNGVYYQESTNDKGETGYVAVPAPIGAKVPSLPEGYETTTAGSHTYFYYGGVFYTRDTDGKYVVVQGPVGAVVTNMPDGAKEEYYNDVLYYNYNGIYFQPKSVNGETQFQVVQHP